MKRGVFIAPHDVATVSHRSTRIAPTSVRLSPQFIGRGSIKSVPRGSHAWERPIARVAPDSSRKTQTSRVYLANPLLESMAFSKVRDLETHGDARALCGVNLL